MSKAQAILAHNLKALIEKKGISQAELGRQTGYSATAAGSWLMTGDKAKFPSPETIDKLCDYFCVSPAQLLSESGEVKPSSYDEKTLLDSFRKLNDTNKNALLVTVQTLLNAQAALEKTESA